MNDKIVAIVALVPVWILVTVCLLKIRKVFSLMQVEMSARAERAKIEKGAPRITVSEDGSVAVTWFGRDGRVSVCFEKDAKESSWHTVVRSKPDESHTELLTQMDVARFRRALASIR